MALLIPDTPAQCAASERQVFQRMQRELPDDWIVLHSLHLLQQDTKIAGEADFIVLSTKGIFVIEVKGSSRVSCHNGVWGYGTPGTGRYYEKRESPFVQANRAMFELQKIIGRNPKLGDLLIGSGVVMPNTIFRIEGPEIEPGVLLDARAYSKNLGFYIGTLARHWDQLYQRKHGNTRRTPTRVELTALRQLLRPNAESTPGLATIFNGLEERLLLLTNQQVRALRGMENNPRTLVTGRAGTGKTVIATDRALRVSHTGARVLYVCFNQLLAKHIASGLAANKASENIHVRHLHGIFYDTISRAGLTARLNNPAVDSKDLYGRIFPEIFFEAAIQSDYQPADVLILDEAQDFLTPENVAALDLMVAGGLEKGRWSMFLDPLQNIYGAESEEAMRILKQAGYADYELVENCRNTREVATQGSIISGIDVAIESAVPGVQCDCIFYRDRNDFSAKIEAELRRLLDGGVPANDIIILSTRQLENSSIAGRQQIAGLEIQDLAESTGKAPGLQFATMHAFKGLERKVVLAIDLDRLGSQQMALLHYAGLSRAITLLRPFVPLAERAAYEIQAKKYGERVVQ